MILTCVLLLSNISLYIKIPVKLQYLRVILGSGLVWRIVVVVLFTVHLDNRLCL